MDLGEIEAKWGKKWADARIFESNPSASKKFFLTAAYPYPNSPQHIGHARTYTTADVYARFKRMQGFNVLFPMGFHVTGTPILAMAKRLGAQEKELLELFEKVFKIPRETSVSLSEPKELVSYFSREIEAGMREMGFSIDWRRKFYTFDPLYNAFIKWQFHKLNEKGLIKKGSHPVPWCPKDNQAVGSHDTRGDVDPEFEEYTLVKFPFGKSFLPAATFRPETVYGATSIWVNPGADYVRALVDGEEWVVSAQAAEKLAAQGRKVEARQALKGKDFSGECTNPATGARIPIFPASFVDPSNGTGIVMSVPAHAPYDFLAIRDYLASSGRLGELEKFLVPVLKIDGYGRAPAREASEAMKIRDQNDPKAEDATTEIYRKEAHTGVMTAGPYAGEKVILAKEKIKRDLLKGGLASAMHEILNGPVYCRCGAQCIVKSVQNQWFIDYGSPEWKSLAKQCLAGMRIIPPSTINEYNYVIDWLKQKACTRAQGLGTRFPFDESQMIEALSDSTLYMAFYTISHRARGKEFEPTVEALDYIFLGKGKGTPALEQARKEFLYWYPLDSRHSATDLVHNHLTFFIFNHAAIFPQALWPRQIVTNGFVLMEGQKMSKSLGNIMPLRAAIRKYGADVVRLSVVSGAELSADSDFNETLAEGILARLKFLESLLEEAKPPAGKKRELRHIDRWFLSRLHRKAKTYAGQLEELKLREVSQDFFYNFINDIKWYARRSSEKTVLREALEYWTLFAAPFMPFIAEEFWERLGAKSFVKDSPFACTAQAPAHVESAIDDKTELGEETVVKLLEDVENIRKIVKIIPKKIFVYTASDFKRKLYRIAFELKSFDKAMKKAMEDPEIKARGKDVPKVLQSLMKNMGSLSPLCLSQDEETGMLNEARPFLEKELKAEVLVLKEQDAAPNHAKAGQSAPFKPSIILE